MYDNSSFIQLQTADNDCNNLLVNQLRSGFGTIWVSFKGAPTCGFAHYLKNKNAIQNG